MGKRLAVAFGVILSASPAWAQFQNAAGGPATSTYVQFNTNGLFGGIVGVTSDQASVGFAPSSGLILYGMTPSDCLTVDANHVVSSQTCSGGPASNTGIAAGSNITTSGTASNVTVNVVATPSFTTLNASGNVTAGTAQLLGALSGTTAVFQTITDNGQIGCIAAVGGVLTGTGVGCASQVSTPSIAAGTNITTSGTAANITINVADAPIFSGNLTGTTAQFSGQVTGTMAVFQSITGAGIATGCVQSTAGLLSGTGSSCGGTGTSIAAGTNITTSGTATNVTVNVAASPSFTNVTASGNLTAATAQFSGQITGTTGVFQTHTVGALGSVVGQAAGAGSVSFVSPSITQFGDGQANANGYINWEGESRITVGPVTITTAVLTPTGLTVNIQGGRTYAVDVDLYIGTSVNTPGVQVALTGTYSNSDTRYIGYVVDGTAGVQGSAGTGMPIRGMATANTKTTAVASANISGTQAYVKLSGTITALKSGTLEVWAAEQVANSTKPLTIVRGSRLMVHDMP